MEVMVVTSVGQWPMKVMDSVSFFVSCEDPTEVNPKPMKKHFFHWLWANFCRLLANGSFSDSCSVRARPNPLPVEVVIAPACEIIVCDVALVSHRIRAIDCNAFCGLLTECL
jgi:hypothetical protein